MGNGVKMKRIPQRTLRSELCWLLADIDSESPLTLCSFFRVEIPLLILTLECGTNWSERVHYLPRKPKSKPTCLVVLGGVRSDAVRHRLPERPGSPRVVMADRVGSMCATSALPERPKVERPGLTITGDGDAFSVRARLDMNFDRLLICR